MDVTFFCMFVTTSICSRKQQDAYAITTKEREKKEARRLCPACLKARVDISSAEKERCNESLTLVSAIIYILTRQVTV